MSTAISNRMPAVVVEYTCRGVRKAKHFVDAFAARRFYTAKLIAGCNPKVLKTGSTVDTRLSLPQAIRSDTMTENTATAAPTKKVTKKAATNGKAKAAKKVAKKVAKAKSSPMTGKKKGGLSKPQVRILKTLAKGASLTRGQISEKAPVDNAMCTTYIGSSNPEVRKNTDKIMPSLLTLGYIRDEVTEGKDSKSVTTYSITASGKRALEAAAKE